MERSWITPGSTRVKSVINPLNAACDAGFVPDTVYLLENPGIEDRTDRIRDLATRVVTAYGGDEPEFVLKPRERETDFDTAHRHTREAIEETHEGGGAAAVDVTPGRKFMSAIAFQAGIRYGADHVYYLFLESEDHFGKTYPEIPRTASRLYDFAEEVE